MASCARIGAKATLDDLTLVDLAQRPRRLTRSSGSVRADRAGRGSAPAPAGWRAHRCSSPARPWITLRTASSLSLPENVRGISGTATILAGHVPRRRVRADGVADPLLQRLRPARHPAAVARTGRPVRHSASPGRPRSISTISVQALDWPSRSPPCRCARRLDSTRRRTDRR